ncbi:Maf-like protein [uncultured Bacteroides sp.]|uniref:Maf-like protein n=1 Tax=uncultured Bacteroides sp. TaxID=162156 RepID=UPI002AA956C4|nr:Maf-like protein [uncultured Bacteroides sp.]
MLDNLKKYNILLASNSPRRKELLTGLGVDYNVVVLPDVDESFPIELKGPDIPLYIAKKKAEAYKGILQSYKNVVSPTLICDNVDKNSPIIENGSAQPLIITADTIVWLNDEVLGKPKDQSDAKAMLRQLSGKTHQVITGVCLTTTEWQKSFVTVSEVRFALLTEEEITYYISHFSPLDKAGSYGVQEWIGFIGVESIKGSYFNVMGLPVQRLYKELCQL